MRQGQRACSPGRVSVSYDDIDDAIVPCLRHRLLRNFQAEAENVTTESILEQVDEAAQEAAHVASMFGSAR